NWLDDQTQRRVPGPNDDVLFVGTNITSTVNQNFTIASLEVQAGHATPISLVGDLTIAGGTGKASSMADPGFSLSGPGKLIIKAGVTFTMSAGTMQGTGATAIEAAPGGQGAENLVLSGPATKTFDGRPVQNNGTLTWNDGDVALKNTATITTLPAGRFSITAVGHSLTSDNSGTSITNQLGSTMSVAIDP